MNSPIVGDHPRGTESFEVIPKARATGILAHIRRVKRPNSNRSIHQLTLRRLIWNCARFAIYTVRYDQPGEFT